jgi:hypothetical protein
MDLYRCFRWQHILGAMLALALASCGGGRKPCFPVVGHVFTGQSKGRVPATGAIVIFTATGPANSEDPCPNARVDTDGKYVVSTYGKGDGAPAGEYEITVHWPAHGRPLSGNPVDRPKARDGKLHRTKLSYAVEKGKMNLVPFIELPDRRGHP